MRSIFRRILFYVLPILFIIRAAVLFWRCSRVQIRIQIRCETQSMQCMSASYVYLHTRTTLETPKNLFPYFCRIHLIIIFSRGIEIPWFAVAQQYGICHQEHLLLVATESARITDEMGIRVLYFTTDFFYFTSIYFILFHEYFITFRWTFYIFLMARELNSI